MDNLKPITRRGFLGASVISAASLSTLSLPTTALPAVTKAPGDPLRGLKLGVASYSLRKFSLAEAIAMTKTLGVKYITLKDMHLPFKTTREERQAARDKIQAAGLTLMGGGVIYMKNDEAQVRDMFTYAQDAGMPVIVGSPDPDALDVVEKMVKEFDIKVAIHNHGPGDKHYPSPLDVLRLVKDRDERLGACIDVGHTVRIGEDPIDAIQQCGSRLYDFHIKDVTAATAKGAATEVGRGVIDIVAVLKALVDMRYKYHLALEYETHENAPMPGMIESFAYMRGVLAALG